MSTYVYPIARSSDRSRLFADRVRWRHRLHAADLCSPRKRRSGAKFRCSNPDLQCMGNVDWSFCLVEQSVQLLELLHVPRDTMVPDCSHRDGNHASHLGHAI